MEYRIKALVGRGLALSLTLCSTSALAQNNPEQGDVVYQTTVQPAPVATTTTTTTSSGPFVQQVATTGTDHSLVVGHLGVGHFGRLSLPYLNAIGDGPVAELSAPTIGARYWLDERLGIEAALGIGVSTGGTTAQMGNMSVETSDPSLFGLALHGGLPLVFATSQHFAFELIPELNFGFVSGGQDGDPDDLELSGVLLELGARVGAEIQFGFIGIPQLALQATVGLHLRYQSVGATVGNRELSRSNLFFGTTVQNAPWDIFHSNVAAIYYF
jgi:hypothetical protein